MITSIKQQNINYKGSRFSIFANKKSILENKFKILLTQDIFAPTVNIKLPESKLEKKALIEVLQKRLSVDKLTKLKNKFFIINADYEHYKELRKINPNDEECINLKKELDKGLKIKDYLKLLEFKIKCEMRNHNEELSYFDKLANLEEEYLKKGIITEAELENFYNRVQKEGINVNKSLSTKDLLKIVENTSVDKKSLLSVIKEKVAEFIK